MYKALCSLHPAIAATSCLSSPPPPPPPLSPCPPIPFLYYLSFPLLFLPLGSFQIPSLPLPLFQGTYQHAPPAPHRSHFKDRLPPLPFPLLLLPKPVHLHPSPTWILPLPLNRNSWGKTIDKLLTKSLLVFVFSSGLFPYVYIISLTIVIA